MVISANKQADNDQHGAGDGEQTRRSDFELPEAVAGNGLLDRRVFLRGGAVLGSVMGYGLVGETQAEPLPILPWMQKAGVLPKPYDTPSCFEAEVIRRGVPSATGVPEIGTVRTRTIC